MWENQYLFYTVFVALVIFIILCFLGILAFLGAIVAINQTKKRVDDIIYKGEETLDIVQEAAYEVPSWGLTFVEGALSFFTKRKKSKKSFFSRFLD